MTTDNEGRCPFGYDPESIGELKAMMQTTLARVTEIKVDLNDFRKEHNGRLRKLEQWRSGIVMSTPLVTVMVIFLLKYVLKVL